MQFVKFKTSKADESINTQNNESPCLFGTFSKYLKGLVAKKIDYNALVCGSLLLTGEHGFYFSNSTPEHQINILEAGLIAAKSILDSDGTKITLTLLKDFFDYTANGYNNFKEHSYNEFSVQPNMIFDINEDWKDFNDYLNALSSKYRVRVRRGRKKLFGIVRKELSEADLEHHNNEIHSMYLNIAKAAGFNVVQLHPGYFKGIKSALGERVKLYGYFLDKKLVAFYSLILNYEELEAHFLGYDDTYNKEYQIYFNILLDMVDRAIEFKVNKIVLSRTALEIKSSIGAKAFDMYCYIKHRNSFSNRFLNPILDYLKPKDEWVPRHPFKD